MLGLVIDTNYTMYRKEFSDPVHKSIRDFVDGPIEYVWAEYLHLPFVMVINRGCNSRQDFKNNPVGSLLYKGSIAGPVVIMKCEHDNYGDMELFGLTEANCNAIIEHLVFMTDEECRLIAEPAKEQNERRAG